MALMCVKGSCTGINDDRTGVTSTCNPALMVGLRERGIFAFIWAVSHSSILPGNDASGPVVVDIKKEKAQSSISHLKVARTQQTRPHGDVKNRLEIAWHYLSVYFWCEAKESKRLDLSVYQRCKPCQTVFLKCERGNTAGPSAPVTMSVPGS